VLLGKFRIERVLGRGGMGVVVAATHLQLGQQVALKFLLPASLVRPESRARFEREARAVAMLKTEHVARILDVGKLENGAPYMVLEYLEGETLAKRLHDEGPLPIPLVAEWLLQACEAIAEAHATGIVHRDLKPANLFLATAADGSPTLKVLDFGVSKLRTLAQDGDDRSPTAAQSILGSPLYMSPEQLRSSKDVDERSDVWSLGVVLYELLTAKMPFEAENVHQQYAMVIEGAAPPPSSHRPEIPAELDAIILRCLKPEPDKRLQSVAELARELAPFAPQHARSTAERVARVSTIPRIAASTPPPAPVSTPPMVSTRPGARGAETALINPPPPRSRVLPIAFGAVGGATLILALAFYTRTGMPDRASQPARAPASESQRQLPTAADFAAKDPPSAPNVASPEATASPSGAPSAGLNRDAGVASIASVRATAAGIRPRPPPSASSAVDPLDLGHRK
jgi:serine/threonine-protein kinase